MSSRLGITVALGLVGVAAFAGVLDATKIAWAPKAGTVNKYKFKSVAHIQAAAMSGDLTIMADMTETTKDVKPDGNIVLEDKEVNFHVTMGDQDLSSSPEVPQSVTESITEKANGETVERHSDHADMDNKRVDRASEFVYPDKPVNVGDTWTRSFKGDSKETFDTTTTYTYAGTETVNGIACNKITVDFKETNAPSDITASGTVWVSADDGYMVKVAMKLKNAVFSPQMPPADTDVNIDRVAS
jgi:hypothetical protein